MKVAALAEAVKKGLLKACQAAGKALLEEARAGAKGAPLLAGELPALLRVADFTSLLPSPFY